MNPFRTFSPKHSKQQQSFQDEKADCNLDQKSNGSISVSSCEAASKDVLWKQMFEEMKAIKEKTGTCNLPDKKGALAKWVYAQRKAFRRLQFSRGTATIRARLEKLESIGFEFASSSYVAWDVMFEKYKNQDNLELNEGEARKLKLWVSNQRLEYSRHRRGLRNNITKERIAKLDSVSFQWVGRTGKPTSSKMDEGGKNNEKKGGELEEDCVENQSNSSKSSLKKSHAVIEDAKSRIDPTDFSQNHHRQMVNERVVRLKRSGPSRDPPETKFWSKGETTSDYYVSTESLRKRGRPAIASRHKKYDVEYSDDEDRESDSDNSESSCSWCEKKWAARAKRRRKRWNPAHSCSHDNAFFSSRALTESQNAKQLFLPTALGAGSSSYVPSDDELSVEDIFPPGEHSGSLTASQRVAKISSRNQEKHGRDLSATARWNPSSLGSSIDASAAITSERPVYIPPAPSAGDSARASLMRNSNGFLQLPGATISSITSCGGLFVSTYLPPTAAAALQQQLQQQRQQQALAGPSSSLAFMAPNGQLPANMQVLPGGIGQHQLGLLQPSIQNTMLHESQPLFAVRRQQSALDVNRILFPPSLAHLLRRR